MKNEKNYGNEIETGKKGYYGDYGGSFVPEGIKPYLKELEDTFDNLKDDENFLNEYRKLLEDYVGRPSSLYYAKALSEEIGSKVYLKREDLNHTGAHKINNTLGQILLAKYMNKKEIIAETGAGQHGVATATAASLFGMDCKIFMGEIDTIKQKPNVQRMKLLGAEVIPVTTGTRTLKDAVDEALKYLIENPDCFYLLGSAVGPHPYPQIVKEFQSVIGKETKKQIMEKEGKLPNYLVACVGGGSNAIGLFSEFMAEENVRMIGVEPSGKGLDKGNHAATLTLGNPGIIHGFRCYLLQNKDGTPMDVYSIASGLDYPGVGPEHSMLKDNQRVKYDVVSDSEALEAFQKLCRLEGIIPALESSHALAYLFKNKTHFKEDDLIVLNLSGRGDKDLETVLEIID